MVSEIHFWEDLSKSDKLKKISIFLSDFGNIEYLLDYFENFKNIEELVDYFNNYYLNLSKNTLNSYLKSVINP